MKYENNYAFCIEKDGDRIYFKILSQHLHRRTYEKHYKPVRIANFKHVPYNKCNSDLANKLTSMTEEAYKIFN